MKMIAFCLLSLLFLVTNSTAQNLYRWVDAEGKVHYSDQPPPKEIKKVGQPKLGTSTIETSDLPFETKRAAENYPVVLYFSDDCKTPCDTGKDFLSKRGIPFQQKNIVSDEDAADFKKLFNSDSILLPAISFGSQKTQGFQSNAWNNLLDIAGYPKTAIPGAKAR